MMLRIGACLLAFGAASWAQNDAQTDRFKVEVGGESRKGGVLYPKDLRKNEMLPLVVAVHDTTGKAFTELDQWAVYAIKHRFAVVSVDCKSPEGWAVSEQLVMQRDMEAVELSIEEAKKALAIDDTAIVIRGHLGGAYLVLWMGVRRPDLFLGVCASSCVFYKEMAPSEKERKSIDPNQVIFLYRGELDTPRLIKETEWARDAFQEAGFARVSYTIVPKTSNVANPDVFAAWYAKLLKETEKGRKALRKSRESLVRLREEIAAGPKPTTYRELEGLAEQDEKNGTRSGAGELLDGILAKAGDTMKRARDSEANQHYAEAAQFYKEVAEAYAPLAISKEAAKERLRLIKSDEYKADEMLQEALRLQEAGEVEKSVTLLEKLLAQYPATPAATSAKRLVG
ncbi:MAG: hypothetical protein ACT4PV_09495 [Planctomycetaceae bacterium]